MNGAPGDWGVQCLPFFEVKKEIPDIMFAVFKEEIADKWVNFC